MTKIPALPATILTVMLSITILAGCRAHTGTSAPPINSTDVKIAELRKSLAEANARIEELNNKFLLLKETIDSGYAKSSPGTHNSATEDASDVTPPKGLKVVKLSENDIAGDPDRKKPGAAAPKSHPKEPAAGAENLYNKGQDLFMAGDYAGARNIFKRLIEENPKSSYTDNAIYWTAESYYSEQNFKMAYEKFHDVFTIYPSENKAPDAMLKAAYSLKELGEIDRASETLNELINRYPDTPAAAKARKAVIKLTYPN
ncbi:MAG: tol-pal system protein YbgF [Deltaproteobacteria bacterium]|nr:tol-pal system protein YbgF [Deltaproteobacteria bacterium]